MYKYCNGGTIKYYGANSLPLSTNLGGQEELVDYSNSFLCQTRRESSDPFFSSWNGQYLTVHNILYCNVLSEDSCPASALDYSWLLFTPKEGRIRFMLYEYLAYLSTYK